MKIQVLGPGCARCKKTHQVMKEATVKMGLNEGSDFTLEKIEDIPEIMKFGITMTPGVVIDGKVIISGKVPSLSDATTMIANHLLKEQQ
jgi:small redox-active disulfide protein 2